MNFFTLKKKETNQFLVQKNNYLMQVCQYMFRDQQDALWNWSNSRDMTNQISQLTNTNHNAYALGTKFVIR